MKPRTRPRRTISSMRPSSALASGSGRCGAPQIGLVQHQVQRLPVGLVQRLSEGCHEPAARGGAAEFREIDDAGERARADQPAEGRAHALVERHVGVPAAEHHDRITRRRAIRTGAQAPPHPERVHDADASARLQQLLDQAFRGIGLA
jgi:hypothetical protein